MSGPRSERRSIRVRTRMTDAAYRLSMAGGLIAFMALLLVQV